MVIYSHPNKQLLTHLKNVDLLAQEKIKKYELEKIVDQEIIKEVISIICKCHDLGKGTSYFQDYLLCEEKENISFQFKQMKNHGRISAILAYNVTVFYLKKNKLLEEYFWWPYFSYLAVLKHHGNLENINDMLILDDEDISILIKQYAAFYLKEMKEIYCSLGLELNYMPRDEKDFLNIVEAFNSGRAQRKLVKFLKNKSHLQLYVLFCYQYSLLLASDKLDASCQDEKNLQKIKDILNGKISLPDNLVDKYKKDVFSSCSEEKINKIREKIYQNVIGKIEQLNKQQRIYSLNVPTGIGKTLTAFSFAVKLKSNLENKAKIIYVLPFTSIIDQTYEVIKKVLEKFYKKEVGNTYLLKHHHLAEKKYVSEEADVNFNQAELLIETWESEVIVTTFVQFLNSILTNSNRSLKKFFAFSNAIIILDEVQTIPYKYWSAIKEILISLTQQMNCYCIFLTATMPLIFSEKDKEIIELCIDKENIFAQMDRIELNIDKLDNPMNLEEFKEYALAEINKNKKDDFLFVLNTIKSSIELYQFLSKHELGEYYYLSTNIIPKQRMEIIEKIKQKKSVRKIIVSTQMIEAGVDIDVDIVYRDFAPLDSINQTAGRCNRNGKREKKGQVHLIRLINENDNNRAFSSYVYKDTIQLEVTKKLFEQYNKKIPENKFLFLANQYFNLINSKKSENESNLLIENMKAFNFSNVRENFHLIENDCLPENIFVEVDDKALFLWQNYCDLKFIKEPFKKKEEFSKLKKDFFSYVISIPKNILKLHPEIEEVNDIYYLHKEILHTCYDLQTGLKRTIEVSTFF